MGFTEISGLQIEHDPVTYKHGMSFATGPVIIPGMEKEVRLTMKKGSFQGSNFLAKWITDTYAVPAKDTKQDILVDLCDESGKVVIRWKVRGAMPIKFDGPNLNASSNEVAIETLELIADGISVDDQP